MLELKNINVTFHKGTVNERVALDNINLHLQDSDFVSVLGTNGAGKSTLLNVISGNIEVDSGTINLDGTDITWLPEYKRAKNIGRLFQDPMKGTAPNMTIEENLGLAYSRGKRSKLSLAIRKQDNDFFKNYLSTVNLGLEDRLKTKVNLLSGGQRQALTLLMSTLVTPNLLLLDEHTAALDPNTANTIMEITNNIIREHKIMTIMITHNIQQALTYGNKLIIMNEGKIVKVLNEEEKKAITQEELLNMYNLL